MPGLTTGRGTPVRAGWSRLRRPLAVASSITLLALTGCSAELTAQIERLGLPEASSDRAPYIGTLWIGTWIAAFIVGFIVLGLILFAALRYQRRTNEMPKQNRYNLPMEIFYTIAPFIIIGVLFYFTVVAQNRVLERADPPDHTIENGDCSSVCRARK